MQRRAVCLGGLSICVVGRLWFPFLFGSYGGRSFVHFGRGVLDSGSGNLVSVPNTIKDGTSPSEFILSFMAFTESSSAISGGTVLKSYRTLLNIFLSGRGIIHLVQVSYVIQHQESLL